MPGRPPSLAATPPEASREGGDGPEPGVDGGDAADPAEGTGGRADDGAEPSRDGPPRRAGRPPRGPSRATRAGLPDEVNMADVAQRAGVSIATVSRALREVPGVSADTRERIRAIAQELSYVVSPEASGLSRRVKGRVAVVVPRLDVWFYSTMLASIEAVLSRADLDVLVYQVDGEAQRTRFFADLPARRKVDAVVLTALPLGRPEVDRLGALGVQVVVAGGRVHDHPRVEVDDAAVARIAVDHLAGLGHRRIAMVRTSDTDGTAWSSDLQRTAGYRARMSALGLAVPDQYVVTMPYDIRAGADAMARLLALPEPPTAVFAYSDELAVSALSELWRRGLSAPGDVSVLGVDGHPLGELFEVTTVVQSVEEQGRLAGELTLALLRDEAPAVLVHDVQPRLVVRATTGPPPTRERPGAGVAAATGPRSGA